MYWHVAMRAVLLAAPWPWPPEAFALMETTDPAAVVLLLWAAAGVAEAEVERARGVKAPALVVVPPPPGVK